MDPINMPDYFLWGVATSAYQIEGAAFEDGRGESIWDRFCAVPGKVRNGDTGAEACDHYHRYLMDIELMTRLGINTYRFSIAWPRILPEGMGRVNQAGLDFYDRLVDKLLKARIRPFATLYHYDLPQTLQERWAGWLGRDTVGAFVNYADVVSSRLGDRVKDWITINQPWCCSWQSYVQGIHAPGYQNLQQGLQVAHHLLVGHGQSVPVIRRNSRHAQIGISNNIGPVYPATDNPEDKEAANLIDGTYNRWFLDALFKGKYPVDTCNKVSGNQPWVHPGDMETIQQPLDFIGVNYYTRSFWAFDPNKKLGVKEVLLDGVKRTSMGWEIYPEGLFQILTWLYREYRPPRIYITENGAAFDDTVSKDGEVHDQPRIKFLQKHLKQSERAIQVGIPLYGYFAWSLMDNFEWAEGYSQRFGLVYVDYKTQKRTIKESGKWYCHLIQTQKKGLLKAI